MCPDQRQVSIEEVGLDPHLQLLLQSVSDEPPRTIYRLSNYEIMSIPIPVTLNTNGYNLTTFFPWNDNKSLILKYVSQDKWQYSFWFGTQDGQLQSEIASLDLSMSYLFAKDYFVVLGDPPDDLRLDNWEFVPFYTVNITTGEKEELPHFATDISWSYFFIKEGSRSYLGYQGSFYKPQPHSYYLYNYTTGDAYPIFQWLDEIEDWYHLIPSIYYRQDSGFMSYVGRSYGFDISKELDLVEMQRTAPYHEMMRAIVMPGEDSRDIDTVVYLGLDNNPIPVVRAHFDSDDPEKILYV